jgi:hypothetical protein
MQRIGFDELRARIERVLVGLGLTAERAALGARLTAETDRDGVRTHGIARLPRFAEMVRLGGIDPLATPKLVQASGAIERWTGHRGPGNLADWACGAGGFFALDAGRDVWVAVGRGRFCGDVLDEYAAESAAVGGAVAGAGE